MFIQHEYCIDSYNDTIYNYMRDVYERCYVWYYIFIVIYSLKYNKLPYFIFYLFNFKNITLNFFYYIYSNKFKLFKLKLF